MASSQVRSLLCFTTSGPCFRCCSVEALLNLESVDMKLPHDERHFEKDVELFPIKAQIPPTEIGTSRKDIADSTLKGKISRFRKRRLAKLEELEKSYKLTKLWICSALIFTSFLLSLIIVLAGTVGYPGDGLAMISIDMGDFLQFHPNNITLFTEDKARERLRRFDAGILTDIPAKATSAAQAVETALSSVKSEAEETVDGAMDKISDVRGAVEDFIMKAIQDIENQLNEWIQDVANILKNLYIARGYSLHIAGFCRGDPVADDHTEVDYNCTLFSSLRQDDVWDLKANNGSILGFQPGELTAEVLHLFMIPDSVQNKMTGPIHAAADAVAEQLHNAKIVLSNLVVTLLLRPLVILYATACASSGLLLMTLLTDIVWLYTEPPTKPLRDKPLAYNFLPRIATFCLLAGTLAITAFAVAAKLINIASSHVLRVTIQSGVHLLTMSWVACLCMSMVFGVLYISEWFNVMVELVLLALALPRTICWDLPRGMWWFLKAITGPIRRATKGKIHHPKSSAGRIG
ncbi:hypothetical protein BJ170DRAFT_722491 [Xylariales sp. AK1849]|nr:hypothetical protein BJ170DRAFT_722491 [Xylariales sp. AK1849]